MQSPRVLWHYAGLTYAVPGRCAACDATAFLPLRYYNGATVHRRCALCSHQGRRYVNGTRLHSAIVQYLDT
jgi:hypothetical protein